MTNSKVILVAEDEENDFFLLNWAFAKQNPQIVLLRVQDGIEAIQYLEGSDGYTDRQQYPFPDLLILDIKMPRKDGLEVLEWVRKHPQLKPLITVILSSSRQDRDVGLAYSLGANSYLTKPNDSVGFKDIAQAINDYWFHWSQRPHIHSALSLK